MGSARAARLRGSRSPGAHPRTPASAQRRSSTRRARPFPSPTAPGYAMTTPLERRLQRARDRFIAEVVHAIECAIIDAIEEAFALALVRRPRLAMSARASKPAHRAAPPPLAEAPS